MSLHGLSLLALLMVLIIAMLLFGTNYLRVLLTDLAVAIKNFSKTLGNYITLLLAKKLKTEKLDSDAG